MQSSRRGAAAVQRQSLVLIATLTLASAQSPTTPDAVGQLTEILAEAQARAAWRSHVEARDRRLAAGEVGTVTVTIAIPAAAAAQPIVVRLIEPLPAVARPRGGLCVTDNFLATGTTRTGSWRTARVPIGLKLVLEVEPRDRSAPPRRYEITGPTRRGQVVELRAELAPRYPVVTGRVLDAGSGPFRGQPIAIEIRVAGRTTLCETVTDRDGRFRAPVRVERHEGHTGTVTVVPGRLRRGGGRLSITELPIGPTARAGFRSRPRRSTLPARVIQLGDLRLGRDR